MMAGVPVILYRSESQINLQLEAMQNQEILTTPIIIYFHGGGWVWLDAGKNAHTSHRKAGAPINSGHINTMSSSGTNYITI